MLRTASFVLALAALLPSGCSEESLGRDRGPGLERAADGELTIATWNMKWLHRNNGAGEVPRDNGDYERMAHYASVLDADIIALQEVDGAEAAARVFDPAEYDFHMSSRSSLQRTGFAYRKGLQITTHPDYTALEIGNLRRGTDLEVEVEGQTLRLLNIHLKSGCFSQSLGSTSSSCTKLAAQVDVLEDWIDDRASEGTPSMVLGDFNRRLFASSNDDVWAELNDGSPAGADLSSPTDSGTALCNDGQYPQFIDHLVTNAAATSMVVEGSFGQVIYSNADDGYELSDHCPLSIQLALGSGEEQGPSCTGSCGGQSPDGCWCDDQCQNYGDCCADKAAVCDRGAGAGARTGARAGPQQLRGRVRSAGAGRVLV